MNWCFHRRWQNNRKIDSKIFPSSSSELRSQFLSNLLEDFVNELTVGNLLILKVQSFSCKLFFNTLHLFTDPPWTVTHITSAASFQQCSLDADCSSCPLLRTRCWVFDLCLRVKCSWCLPGQKSNPDSGIPGTFEAPGSKEAVWHCEQLVSWNQRCRSRFRYPETLLLSLSFLNLSSTWSSSCSMERNWLQDRIERFMMLNKRRRRHRSSRVKLPLTSKWAKFAFDVSTYLIWILGEPSWFCQTISLMQLCGIWTRVSSLDFFLWWSFSSPLRYLQKCKIVPQIDKNLRLWSRDPDLTLDQHFDYLSFSAWCWNFASSVLLLPGKRNFMLFEECKTSITTSHRSRVRIHLFANQYPTK